MATRAPKGAARPRGGTASRTRQTASTARRSGSATRNSRGSGKAYRAGTKRPAGRKPAARRPARKPKSTNPIAILAGWLASVLAGIWMALAHTVGSVARVAGNSARDLDPLHRRDGIGLAALCGAIIAAAATWWHIAGPVKPADKFLVAFFGSGSWTVPVLLALLAWRFLRHPDNNAATARMVVGWSALVVGALGLAHVASGTPRLSGGLPAIRSAGGLIGAGASVPLVDLVTKWGATPVLALVAGFGLLVITGTPLHRVPDRLRELLGFGRGQEAEADAQAAGAEGGEASGGPLRLGRKKTEAIEAGARDRAYDSPLLTTTIKPQAYSR